MTTPLGAAARMRVEYRVAWRRDDGGRLRSKRAKNAADGVRIARFLAGDLDDPEAFNCCDARVRPGTSAMPRDGSVLRSRTSAPRRPEPSSHDVEGAHRWLTR